MIEKPTYVMLRGGDLKAKEIQDKRIHQRDS
jgi:hypothetical protein